jgi:hypothetical protein
MTTKKILSPLELLDRVEELEKLLKCVNHNLETIHYSCKIDGSVAGRNLAKETLEWIAQANIPA